MDSEIELMAWYRKLLQNPPFFDGKYNSEESWAKEDWCRFFKVENPKDIKVRNFVLGLIKEGILIANGDIEINGRVFKSYVLAGNKLVIVNAYERTEGYKITESLYNIDKSKDKGTY